jgi:hypothetical protein
MENTGTKKCGMWGDENDHMHVGTLSGLLGG